MEQIDLPTIVNWLVSGFIGALFGAIGAWVVYRFERKRDDIAWARDRKKQLDEFMHDKELLETQYQQRLKELQVQTQREESAKLRQDLLRGVDSPREAIAIIHNSIKGFTDGHFLGLHESQSKEMDLISEIERMLREFLSK
jgi:hypothetical protein